MNEMTRCNQESAGPPPPPLYRRAPAASAAGWPSTCTHSPISEWLPYHSRGCRPAPASTAATAAASPSSLLSCTLSSARPSSAPSGEW